MGKRHATYGVQDAHYESVANALLWALQEALGADFSMAIQQAWSAAYTLLADVMKEAANSTDYRASRSYALANHY